MNLLLRTSWLATSLVLIASCSDGTNSLRTETNEVQRYEMEETGVHVPADVTAEEPLAVEGKFQCVELRITRIGKAERVFAGYTVEVRGGRVINKEGKKFDAEVSYAVEAGGALFEGTEDLFDVEPSGIDDLSTGRFLPNPFLETAPPNVRFSPLPNGLSSCKFAVKPVSR